MLIVGFLAVVINFVFTPAFSLLPLLVKEYFDGDAVQFGCVEAAIGIGIMAGGALLSVWGGFKRKILTSMIGLMGMGDGGQHQGAGPCAFLGSAPGVGGALPFGSMNPITMGPFFAVIQSTVEPDMQARIYALMSSIGTGIAPVGLMIAGPVADRVGIQAWFFLGGSVCVSMAVAGLCIPAVMNIEENRSLFLPHRAMLAHELKT